MIPPIGTSVRRLTTDRWRLGSSKVCERVTTLTPSNAIASWEDKNGTDLVHEGGTSAAVWNIGPNIFCKVKAWCEGLESEGDAIQFVGRKVPSVPLPQIIYSWIDYEWNRSFLILRRVDGQTLRDCWPRLSLSQKTQIASQIARYCCELAKITSLAFESATHCGVLEPFLTPRDRSHPSWKPRPLGPLSLTDFTSHLPRKSTTDCPDIGSCFHYYHADLGPGNIIISERGNVEGILDWESAGFYPRFWIATKPAISAGFYLNPVEGTKREAWRDLLGSMLQEEGFEPAGFTIEGGQTLYKV
ncbi:hypothetical protein LARI1_G009076 [Lachnellula arida]|uniref:Aminoglycoside phosphotransferase domain-containing protein n=1 Tax=Lachnellula arida TaxID=1316785 RepID=A0A8T9AYG6_9HELO|nr:hypothetical protein LARI1_G009076 [Lachnellula arida]